MKTALVLIITAIASVSFAGPSDGAAFAIRAGKEYAARQEAANNRIALVRGSEQASSQCSCGSSSAQKAPQALANHGNTYR